MTNTSAPVPNDEAVTRRLAALQDRLTNDLARIVDVEAGLREILIYARHDETEQRLNRALDVEAGLAAILPAPPSAPQPKIAPSNDAAEIILSPLHRHVQSLAPDKRLALRSHPVVRADIASYQLAQNVSLDLALVRNLALARDVARDLDLASDLERDLELASALVRDLAHIRVHDLVPDPDPSRAYDRDLDLTLALARTYAVGLAYDLDLRGRALGPALAPRLDRALNHAREVVRGLDFLVGRLLGLQRAEGLGALLQHGLLDDVTGDDLSGLDLSGVELAGLRWSIRGTRWPAEIDIEWLTSNSKETPPGSGIYVVHGPPTSTARAIQVSS